MFVLFLPLRQRPWITCRMSNKKLTLLTHYASTCPHVLGNHVVRVRAPKRDLSNKGHIITILGVCLLVPHSSLMQQPLIIWRMLHKKPPLLIHYTATYPLVFCHHVVRMRAAKRDLSNKGRLLTRGRWRRRFLTEKGGKLYFETLNSSGPQLRTKKLTRRCQVRGTERAPSLRLRAPDDGSFKHNIIW